MHVVFLRDCGAKNHRFFAFVEFSHPLGYFSIMEHK